MYRVDIVGNVEIIVTYTTGMSSWNTNTYICNHNGATNHISALIAYQISLRTSTYQSDDVNDLEKNVKRT